MPSLKSIVKEIGASSAAIMVPNVGKRYLYCYDSFNMPAEWVAIKNSFDEDTPGGNVEVYKAGVPAVTNHLQKTLAGHYIESVMIVPVKRSGTSIATLELIHSNNNKAFTDDDLQKALNLAEKINIT